MSAMTKVLTKEEVAALVRKTAEMLSTKTGSPMVLVIVARSEERGPEARAEIALRDDLGRDSKLTAAFAVTALVGALGLLKTFELPKPVADAVEIMQRKLLQFRKANPVKEA